MPLVYGFALSFAFAIYSEVKICIFRASLVSATSTAISFSLSVLAAQVLRCAYLGILSELNSNPDVVAYIGTEYYVAISNKVVGYGSCFGLGLFAVRLLLFSHIERFLLHVMLKHELAPSLCSHCNQALPGR